MKIVGSSSGGRVVTGTRTVVGEGTVLVVVVEIGGPLSPAAPKVPPPLVVDGATGAVVEDGGCAAVGLAVVVVGIVVLVVVGVGGIDMSTAPLPPDVSVVAVPRISSALADLAATEGTVSPACSAAGDVVVVAALTVTEGTSTKVAQATPAPAARPSARRATGRRWRVVSAVNSSPTSADRRIRFVWNDRPARLRDPGSLACGQ